MVWLAAVVLFLTLCVLLSLLLPSRPPHGGGGASSGGRRGWRPDCTGIRFRTRIRSSRSGCRPAWGTCPPRIRRVESMPNVYARAHRLMALEAAYDDLLDEACRLAGCPGEAEQKRSEEKRWQEEQELAARGWSW